MRRQSFPCHGSQQWNWVLPLTVLSETWCNSTLSLIHHLRSLVLPHSCDPPQLYMACRSKERAEAARASIIDASGSSTVHTIIADCGVKVLHIALIERIETLVDIMTRTISQSPDLRRMYVESLPNFRSVRRGSIAWCAMRVLYCTSASLPPHLISSSADMHTRSPQTPNHLRWTRGHVRHSPAVRLIPPHQGSTRSQPVDLDVSGFT